MRTEVILKTHQVSSEEATRMVHCASPQTLFSHSKPTKKCISLVLRLMNELFWQSNQISCVLGASYLQLILKVTRTVFFPVTFSHPFHCIFYLQFFMISWNVTDGLGFQNCLLAQVNDREYPWPSYLFCLQFQPMIPYFLLSASLGLEETSCFSPSSPLEAKH